MTTYGYDPRLGPIGYQPVEFLDSSPMFEAFEDNESPEAAHRSRSAPCGADDPSGTNSRLTVPRGLGATILGSRP